MLLNPLRPIVQKFHSWRVNKYIEKELQKQFMEHAFPSTTAGKDPVGLNSLKSIASLVLKNYVTRIDSTSTLR